MTAPDPWAAPLTVAEPDLVDTAVQTLRLRHPEWQPNEGNIEVMLIEALAVIAGQTGYAVTQLPSIVLGQLLTLYGVPRQPGQPAAGQVHVQGASSMGSDRTLTAGTVLRIRRGDGTSFDLALDGDLTVTAASQEGWVTVTTVDPGARPNGTPVGTPVEIVEGSTWIEMITISAQLTGGLDAEADAVWFTRGAAALRRRRSALVLPGQFADAALDTVGVARSTVVDRWDGTSATPGDDLGHVTVVAIDADGATLDTATKTTVGDDLQAQALAALTIHINDPAFRDGTLTWSVVADPDADPDDVKDAVHAAVEAHMSPTVWPFGHDPNEFALATLIGQVDGVAAVNACSWAWDDPAPTPTSIQLVGTIGYADQTVDQP